MPGDEETRDIGTYDATVTLINVIEIPTDQIDRFMVGWRERADIMRNLPGFRDYQLHRALVEESRFQLVNVAHWESREALEAAMTNPEFLSGIQKARESAPDVQGRAAVYKVVASDCGQLPAD